MLMMLIYVEDRDAQTDSDAQTGMYTSSEDLFNFIWYQVKRHRRCHVTEWNLKLPQSGHRDQKTASDREGMHTRQGIQEYKEIADIHGETSPILHQNTTEDHQTTTAWQTGGLQTDSHSRHDTSNPLTTARQQNDGRTDRQITTTHGRPTPASQRLGKQTITSGTRLAACWLNSNPFVSVPKIKRVLQRYVYLDFCFGVLACILME